MQTEPSDMPTGTDADPNDWDHAESVFEFIHREYARLLARIPAEFEPVGFRISFIATTDKPEYPIETYFTVAARMAQVGEMKCAGRNPSVATMRLIEAVYKEYAKILHQENEERRRERARRDAEAREQAARESLLTYSSQEIADMADGGAPLPTDVTAEMVEERSRKVAIETVRELLDVELEEAVAPAFLSERERDKFADRCASELRARSQVHEVLDRYQEHWPSGKDGYTILLQIWKLCARQARLVEDILLDFFYGNDTAPREGRTLELLLPIALEYASKVRRARAKVSAAARQRELEEIRARHRRTSSDEWNWPKIDLSKTSAPY